MCVDIQECREESNELSYKQGRHYLKAEVNYLQMDSLPCPCPVPILMACCLWLPSCWLCRDSVVGQVLTVRLHSSQNPSPQGRHCLSWHPAILAVLCIIPDNYDHYTNFFSKLYIYIFLQHMLLPKHAKLHQTLYPCFLGDDFKNCEDKLKSVFLV